MRSDLGGALELELRSVSPSGDRDLKSVGVRSSRMMVGKFETNGIESVIGGR
jgi:hypothetical protein